MIDGYISKILCRLFRLATNRRPLEPSAEEMKLISEIKAVFNELPVINTESCLPSEREWFENLNTFRQLVLDADPRVFLRWEVIKRTMLVENSKYVGTELDYLKQLPDWKERWSQAIKETKIGSPVPYWRYPASSENLIHHAYHVAKFENEVRPLGKMNVILEFGGGYGSMCRLMFNLGFGGKYIIFDFPAFSALQKFFLKSIGIRVFPAELFSEKERGVFCISDMDQLIAVLHASRETKNSMFIATWSISETPLNFRPTILNQLDGFRCLLIGYQARFGEVDNISFFQQWSASREDVAWNNSAIKHLPGNYYLMGKERATH